MKRFPAKPFWGLKPFLALVVGCTLAIPFPAAGQTTAGPDQTASATASPAPPPANGSAAPATPQLLPQAAVPGDRPISWKLLIPNILHDQQRVWMFPAKVAEGKHWVPTVAILAAAAGLIALDPTEGSYFHKSTTYNSFNNVVSGNNATYGIIAAPLLLYAAGFARHDKKMTGTALLAGEAVGDAEIVATVLKDATRRVRPAAISVNGGNYSDTWFESKGSAFRGNGSFPSGHTIAAMSIATIIARRYGNHRWVPYAAYGAAALVGFSRLTLSAHFLSDVFVGGALGYSISRFAVLQQ